MQPLRVCTDILAHIEEKYALPSLHGKFAKKEKTAHLNGLFTEDGLRGMPEGKSYYAVNMFFRLLHCLVIRALVLTGAVG